MAATSPSRPASPRAIVASRWISIGSLHNTDIGEAFEPGDHLSTFGRTPVSCAAALANIDYLLESKLADEALRKGNYFLPRLRELQERHELIGDVRGLGLMVGVELVKDQKLKPPRSERSGKDQGTCAQQGRSPRTRGSEGKHCANPASTSDHGGAARQDGPGGR